MRDERNLEPADIARRVAMKIREVNRRYRAFKALEQMQEDDEFGDYVTPALYPLFHEAVSLPSVREWLGWDGDANRFTNEDELTHFYTLITPQETDGAHQDPKISKHSEVRELRTILPNEEAKNSLFDMESAFVDAVAIAMKEEISQAWSATVRSAYKALQTLGFEEFRNLSAENRRSIEDVRDLAADILRSHDQLRGDKT